MDICTGMVADKHRVDAEKARELGMLTPQTGIAALGAVLGGLELRNRLSAVHGAAGLAYWQKLLSNVKPLPHIFAGLMQQQPPVSAQVQFSWHVNFMFTRLYVIQSNLAQRLFDKRRFCYKQMDSRDFRSLCAHSVAVSLSDRNTVSERFSQLPWATAYQSSTVMFY